MTLNEERNLPRVLESLPPGMRAIVVDSHSSDRTAQVARECGASVELHAFEGFVEQRRFALGLVTTPWTLMIDADEWLDEDLRDAVMAAPDDASGYYFSRTTYFRGRPMRMWQGEMLLRLFRTELAEIHAAPAAGGSAQVHETWSVPGTTAHLRGTLLHDSYPDEASYRLKYDRYTSLEARGLAPSLSAAARETLLVPLRFAWYALRRGAVRDGSGGLFIAWMSARYPAVVRWKAIRR